MSLEEQVITKYYYAGGQRVAVRKNGELSYLLGDHLGSASVVADVDGGLLSETLYKPCPFRVLREGETRYSGGAVMPTDRLYTGQIAEPILGLYFYNARWYDSSLSRFAQADTIVPLSSQGVQAWDRYAGMNNNPVKYTDPSGHFTEDEIDRYLISAGISDASERARIMAQWRDDDEWWKVIGPGGATYGDVLVGDKLLLGAPWAEIVIRFTKNEEADTFGFWGVRSGSKSFTNSDYSLLTFYDEASDIIWMRPDTEGNLLYFGGTGYGGDGANVQGNELFNSIFHGGAALAGTYTGVSLLVAPEPTIVTKVIGVAVMVGVAYELNQAWISSHNFVRSLSAAARRDSYQRLTLP